MNDFKVQNYLNSATVVKLSEKLTPRPTSTTNIPCESFCLKPKNFRNILFSQALPWEMCLLLSHPAKSHQIQGTLYLVQDAISFRHSPTF